VTIKNPLTSKQTSVEKVLTGPLSLVNYKCEKHANLSPAVWRDVGSNPEKSFIQVNTWLCCATYYPAAGTTPLPAGTELTLFYGKEYTKVLKCSACIKEKKEARERKEQEEAAADAAALAQAQVAVAREEARKKKRKRKDSDE
jgi:hypothetical protein